MYLFIISLLMFLACDLKGWHGTLLDFHSFRQTQTAITVSSLLGGSSWLRYETPILGPPWSIPFEFPLYQLIVAMVAKTGWFGLDQSGRFVSICFFLLALFAIYKILENLSFPRNERFIALSLICFSPQYLFWTRTFMIESTALALSACYLWLVMSCGARDLKRYSFAGYLACIGILGSLAGIVKITTFFAFLAGSFIYVCFRLYHAAKRRVPDDRISMRNGLLLGLFALVVPATATLAWTFYADSIKVLHPIGYKLSSHFLSKWNFGTIAQKTSLETWRLFYDRTLTDLLGSGSMLLCGVVLTIRCRPKRTAIAAISFLLFLLPLCTFTNLHFIHNYYVYANGIFLLLAVGAVISDLCSSNNRLNQILGILYFLTIAGLSLTHYFNTFWPAQGAGLKFADMRNDVARYTTKDDVIIILGADWSAEMPYYFQRRAFMYPEWARSDSAYSKEMQNLSTYNIGAAMFCGKERDPSDFNNKILTDFKLSKTSFLLPYDNCNVYFNASRNPNMIAKHASKAVDSPNAGMTEAKSKPLFLKDYGPMKIKAGAKFNIQPSGSSALWVHAENLTSATVIVINGNRLTGDMHGNDPTLCSSLVPAEIYKRKGVYAIYLLDTKTGTKSNQLKFIVE